jgi:glyceraldehyde-3-phosphate dehydrogenase (NADP+)
MPKVETMNYKLLIAGEWEAGTALLPIYSPYDGNLVGTTYWASPEQCERAVAGLQAAAPVMAGLSAGERRAILEKVVAGLRKQRPRLVELLALEAGKPLREGEAEFERALLTVQTAAEETQRICGAVLPLDWLPATKGRFGIIRRFPLGPVLAITPFNYPLNLVLHKLAPAIAAGNPILLKPSPRTPLIALEIGEIFCQAGLPKGALSVLVVDNDTTRHLVAEERFRLVTFTGSAEVGWQLKSLAGKKKVVLELGGNAAVIIAPDADLEYAAERIKFGGFVFAGQSCISVQRIFVQESIFEKFREILLAKVKAIKLGNPLDPQTQMGPLIDDQAAQRVLNWIKEAQARGAEILTGGNRLAGSLLEPTVMVKVPPDCKLSCEEVFGPIVILTPYAKFTEALAGVNNSRFGLQAGIFTNRQDYLWQAYEQLQVGALIANDVPTFRIDPMPYGGIKDSGLGREGPRFAIEEMTEMRLLVIKA